MRPSLSGYRRVLAITPAGTASGGTRRRVTITPRVTLVRPVVAGRVGRASPRLLRRPLSSGNRYLSGRSVVTVHHSASGLLHLRVSVGPRMDPFHLVFVQYERMFV